MAQFIVTHSVMLAVDAETEEDAQTQAQQWHGLVVSHQFEAVAEMATSGRVVPSAPPPPGGSMSTGV